MMKRLTLALGVACGLAISAQAEEAPRIDTHMHLHPLGLDAVLGAGGAGERDGAAARQPEARRQMKRQLPENMAPRGQRMRRGAGPASHSADARQSRSGAGRSEGQGPRMTDSEMAAGLNQAADAMVRKMDQHGVDKSLIVMVPSHWGETEDVLRHSRDAVARHPNRLHMVSGGARLNPLLQQTDPDAADEAATQQFDALIDQVVSEGTAGFGEMIAYHLCMTKGHSFQKALADHPLYLRLADAAARHDIPIDLHMEAVERAAPMPNRIARACSENPSMLTPTIPGLERLLEHNRDARIVWQHVGWDNTGQMTPALLQRLMAGHPNLYLSLRVVTLPDGYDPASVRNRILDSSGGLVPAWRELIEAFPRRVMLGADEFVSPDDEKASLARSFSTTWSIPGQLPSELAAKLGGENAQRVYQLR